MLLLEQVGGFKWKYFVIELSCFTAAEAAGQTQGRSWFHHLKIKKSIKYVRLTRAALHGGRDANDDSRRFTARTSCYF